MAIRFDERSAAINIDWGGVRPNIFANRDVAVFHLTRGFKPFLGTNIPIPNAAWTATGHVRVSVGAGESLKDWNFGFIQIARVKEHEKFYVGATRKDGSAALPNLLSDSVTIDAGSSNPFSAPPVTGGQLKPPLLSCKTDDHPFSMFPLQWENRKKRGTNLLFHAKDSFDFWTILSLQAPNGNFTHLAHFKWFISYEVKILGWQGPVDNPRVCNSLVILDSTKSPEVIAGPPAELYNSGLKLDGVDISANYRLNENNVSLFARRQGVSENDDWFSNVPRNFFNP